MTEVSGFEALSRATAAVQRKSSNMSTNSDDSYRKISSDSGIGIGMGPMSRIPASYDDLVGEPKLSTDISAAMLLAHQQNLSAAAAAALNPAMLGLMSAGFGGLFANPLATAMLQQEAVAARKLLETPGNGGRGPPAGNGALKTSNREQLSSVYPGFASLVHPTSQISDQLLPESLRNQLLSRKISEDLSGGSAVKATRKANSFSGTSSPLNRQFSPPTTSPSLSHSFSPSNRGLQLNSGADERQPSPYGDDDSVGSSSKSSVRCRSPLTSNSMLDGQTANPYGSTSELGHSSVENRLPFQANGRRRKNGIIGSMPLPDLSSYPQLGAYAAQPAAGADVAMHKLSTASLPANLPSNRSSLVPEPMVNRGSPATSRKRQRNTHSDEKVGSRREDESYWERRRKNNEAAKRSRDSRRAKEDEIAIRAAFLEQENYKLRLELTKVKEELTKLQAEMEKHTKKPNGEVIADAASEAKAADNDVEEGGREVSPEQTTS